MGYLSKVFRNTSKVMKTASLNTPVCNEMPPMETPTLGDEAVLKRADELAAKLQAQPSTEKYEGASRILATANAVLFITLVWKAFDATTGLPLLAKFAMLFFLFGIIAIAARYAFDYLGDGISRRPLLAEIAEFFETHKQVLARARPEEYKAWEAAARFTNGTEKWLTKMVGANAPSNEFLVFGYAALDIVCLLVSCGALSIGGFLLFIAALFK